MTSSNKDRCFEITTIVIRNIHEMAHTILTYLLHVNLPVKSSVAFGMSCTTCFNEKISVQNNKEYLRNSTFTEYNILSHIKKEIVRAILFPNVSLSKSLNY